MLGLIILVDGIKIEPAPFYHVMPGSAVLRRVIIPSSAQRGQPFRVSLISLDQFNNLSSSSYSGISITCNDSILEFSGYSRNNLIGKYFSKKVSISTKDISRYMEIINERGYKNASFKNYLAITNADLCVGCMILLLNK